MRLPYSISISILFTQFILQNTSVSHISPPIISHNPTHCWIDRLDPVSMRNILSLIFFPFSDLIWWKWFCYHKLISNRNGMVQHPAGCASAHGCSDWSPANGGASGVTWDACDVGGPPKPLLNASACNDSIKRLAAWRSASRSSAVCRLQIEKKNKQWNEWTNTTKTMSFIEPVKMNKLLLFIGVVEISTSAKMSASSFIDERGRVFRRIYPLIIICSAIRWTVSISIITLWSEFSDMATYALVFRVMYAFTFRFSTRCATTQRVNASTLNNSIKLWWCCLDDDNSDKVYMKMQLGKALCYSFLSGSRSAIRAYVCRRIH